MDSFRAEQKAGHKYFDHTQNLNKLGRKRNAGYIKICDIYLISWPRIMKVGQIKNRLNLHQLVP